MDRYQPMPDKTPGELKINTKLFCMRPIWTGAIGFGLVNIPVKLYSATERSEISLDMLDKKDHSKIVQADKRKIG